MGFGIEESAEFRKELGADVMVDYWISVQVEEPYTSLILLHA